MKNIIIDTDIGGDIDDAMAIALSLLSNKIKVKGITTVFTHVDLRTQLALELTKKYGFEGIPVAKGSDRPILGTWDDTLFPDQCKVLKEKVEYNCDEFAPDFILRKINENDDLTIVALGPLTNIAMAILKDPSIVNKTRILMMGGMVTKAYPEWNIYCDPEAARIVFESGIPIIMVGLDVTLRCKLDDEELKKIGESQNKGTQFLCELIKVFRDSYNLMPTLHDPLAISTLIWPELYEFKDKEIRVETRGEFTRGVTVDYEGTSYGYNKNYNARVCTDINDRKFVEFVLERLINNN